jgi:hypothetical protein
MTKRTLKADIKALSMMELEALRCQWRSLIGSDPPKVSAALLRLAIAYEMQARLLGGLSPNAEKQLRTYRVGNASSNITPLRTTRPGMRLVRVWRDVAHVVMVNDAGDIEWNGRTWRSLSEVARVITGTQWSGPRFFGLRDRKNAA